MTDTLIVNDPASWTRITAEAKAQTREELIALEQAPVEFGQFIAWSLTAKVGAATDGLSPIHRVGLPKGNGSYTTCGEPIPEPAKWLPLSTAMTRTMARCGFCEAAVAEQARGIAA